MSTIQFQVKKRIFEKFNISGFKSLVRSSDLLEKFMEKIGLIGGGGPEVSGTPQEEPVSDVIQVQLGNAPQIFNPLNDHYVFEFLDELGTVGYAYLEVHNLKNRRKSDIKIRQNVGVECNLTLGSYYPGKWPPKLAYNINRSVF